MPTPIRVAIVSGDRMFREVLTALCSGSQGLEVVACEDETRDGVDVVLVDAGFDPNLALVRVRAARERWAEAEAVVLGLDREDESVVDFVEAGAHAYVLQGASPEGLVTVVREVHEKRSPTSPQVVTAVLRRIATLSRLPVAPLPPRFADPLTSREAEILALLARGLGNKEICQRLHITVQTVKNHVHSILAKLQVHRRREAVRFAYETGLLVEPEDEGERRV
ncbi:MAG TPA: response regulator transcription factor [Thermoanaerobaculia bacterium]|nr:response regulator transcription factor [Thermoanaerobaculia bacterium]